MTFEFDHSPLFFSTVAAIEALLKDFGVTGSFNSAFSVDCPSF